MGNISYFCIVKRLKRYFRYSLTSLFLFSFCNAFAATDEVGDSIEISLLTCQPHQEVYSLYGHTAIRYRDRRNGTDIAVNYGMFSFRKPFFVLRFIFGLTDYEMGIEPFEDFCAQYASYGSGVRQQTLRLSKEDKTAIEKAITKNYLPENRVYRYNYFYDNCTSRARDILLNNMRERVIYTSVVHPEVSFRDMVHACCKDAPWTKFGNDLLLGVMADRKTTRTEQQFLPDHLRKDFDHALIVGKKKAPLVAHSFWVVPPGVQTIEESFPLNPATCGIILLIVSLVMMGIELWKRRICWAYDALLMLTTGLAGIVLFAMIFSQHPTVSINLQILLLNPLALVMLYPVTKATIKKRRSKWWIAEAVFLLLFFIGAFVQTYAEGMYALALALLTRCVIHQLLRPKSYALTA